MPTLIANSHARRKRFLPATLPVHASQMYAKFLQAIDYYESCEAGLGYDFAIEVHFTIGNVLKFSRA